MIEKINKTCDFLFKNRYWIAIVIFILCIIFELSGSSIGIWNQFINSGDIDDGVILGVSREIRSDEWAVLTPMTFSQNFDGFSYFSNLIRGGNTDVSMVYALPIMNPIQIFRPFQIGFLFLGIAKGLSFFWYGRLIALFLVMIELFMIITKKNKLLSFIGSVLITFAPTVQWWFAVNGIAEIFIFGGLAIILLHQYILTENFKKRCLYLLGMVICAGGYVLVLYPAWQIPMFYVFLAIAISEIITNRKSCKIRKKDIISIIIALLLFVICMGIIFVNSLDTIKAVMNTVYPGGRAETGGGQVTKIFQYAMNIFLPYKSDGIITNVCEEATMFTLFPMGLILSAIVFGKEQKKDIYLVLLLIIYIFLSIWCIIGFPEIIAKLTLLSNSTAKRSIMALGFAEVLILIRSMSIIKTPQRRFVSIIFSIILSVIVIGICQNANPVYFSTKMLIAMFIMCIYLFFCIFRYQAKYAKELFCCGIVFVMLMTGATVNPIRSGVNNIYQSEIITKIQEIQKQEEGKWIVEGLGFPIANYVLMAGVPVINSTNVYPDMEKWHKIDTEGKYEDVYNRYAHITIELKDEEEILENKFVLTNADSFTVYLTPEELQKLDIKYIFTANNLEEYNKEKIEFKKICDNINGYGIYQLYEVKK